MIGLRLVKLKTFAVLMLLIQLELDIDYYGCPAQQMRTLYFCPVVSFLWPPYVIGGHYIFALWFLLSSSSYGRPME